MLIPSKSYNNCSTCHFAPFCVSEKKNSRTTKSSDLAVKRHRYLKRKESLCLPKNKFQHLYIIQQGALKAFQVEPDGKELIQRFYFAGEILGYESIYPGEYQFAATALCETVVCEIPYEDFLNILLIRPHLQKQAFSLFSKQLNAGAYLSSTTAEQRLASFLIDLSVRLYPLEPQEDFVIPMSRQDIGNYLRLTAETISRIFSRLAREKVIAIESKRIKFINPDRLQEIAEGI